MLWKRKNKNNPEEVKAKEEKDKAIMGQAYKGWVDDFGFLNLMMSKKMAIVKEYYIKPMTDRQQDGVKGSYIKGDDLDKMYLDVVTEIFSSLSKNYTDYLISKYFSDEKALIEFVSESVYSELVSSAVNANSGKIVSQFSSKERQAQAGDIAKRRRDAIASVEAKSKEKDGNE